MTDTPFFDERPATALADEDIARAVMYALSQPPGVNVGVRRPSGACDVVTADNGRSSQQSL